MKEPKKQDRELDLFNSFAKKGTSSKVHMNRHSKTVIAYTRVSGKEQEKNMSLPSQRMLIDDYAKRNGLNIIAYFGGKYESAKTDGRKEFQRMLDFIKQSKGQVSQILVYTADRFSRTGGSAIKLAQDLRDNYGVIINAISQPTDVTNPTGEFQQNIQFLFSNYDNVLRKQRATQGMKYKLERGEWIVRPPQGYDIVKINGDRKIVINEDGKKLKKAFKWKIDGLKNEEIILKLRALGLKNIYKQQMLKIFKNPFYCGIISHGLLDGKIVEGNHEKMISKDDFLRINGIMKNSALYGVSHKRENENLPLKVFMKCDSCSQSMTGYIVKKKNLYYYKCKTIGCRNNKSAKELHKMFSQYISKYSLNEEIVETLKEQLIFTFEDLNKDKWEMEKSLKIQLTEIDKKLDTIEEKFYALNQMDAETFTKFKARYLSEKENIVKELDSFEDNSSNLSEMIENVLEIGRNLHKTWEIANITEKERLQKLIFPEGIRYSHKNDVVRTTKTNLVFDLIASISGNYDKKEKGTEGQINLSSLSAEREGFEPSIRF